MKALLKCEVGVSLALAFCALLAAIVGTLFYFLLFERPYLSYTNLPFPAGTTSAALKVKQGDIAPLKVMRCSTSDRMEIYSTTHALRGLDDGRFYMLPDVQVMIMPGCTTGISYVNRLPAILPPGKYELFGTAEVHGTLKTFLVPWHSQPFNVVAD
jgi:hypothetical protein